MIDKTKITVNLVNNANWFVLTAFFFALGIIAPIFFITEDVFLLTELTSGQKEILEEMAKEIFEGPPLRGILLIFFNNFFSSLFVMFLGVILGIPPLLGLFSNGALLGFIMTAMSNEEVPVIFFIVLGILPHGIFELPAFFISAALGLKTGFHLIFPIKQKTRKESIGYIWKEYWSLFPLVVWLLLLGAVIEIIVTPRLLSLVL